VKVERKDGGVDSYPLADGYQSIEGELVVCDSDETMLACYAAGTWVRVYSYDPEGEC
jgi:hypothetical protein